MRQFRQLPGNRAPSPNPQCASMISTTGLPGRSGSAPLGSAESLLAYAMAKATFTASERPITYGIPVRVPTAVPHPEPI